ncbi:GfV-C16-ORF1 [Ichnoviriform fumiferanae]|uniref:protein-tyrosine-phosphatase n=1 Tax=Ichnoviriform fumiferanae TaxID=419435 RepID=A2PZY2_9VIRU|nr:GfV-C16-ORF1 [Ichnoviriform fumiferanae]BAF45554.1 GfV-C16-ORF1 [Ichnoviriform fumiferanae]
MGNVLSTRNLSTSDNTIPLLLLNHLHRNNLIWKMEYMRELRGRSICEHSQSQANTVEASSVEMLSINVSNITTNRRKNRYQCVPCFHHSRVVLSTSADTSKLAYIDANYIDGFELEKKFIATQAPKSGKDVTDFYNMIWENKCKIIVVLANFFENKNNKFYPYWPMSVGFEMYGKYKLCTTRISNNGTHVKFFLLIENTTTTRRPRSISLFHYLNWPQHGVPLKIHDFISFFLKINVEALGHFFTSPRMGPIVVHGNAGVGRTGTFCALDVCFEEWHKTHVTNVLDTVKRIRRQRYMSVTTADQYAFIFRTLEILQKWNIPLKY